MFKKKLFLGALILAATSIPLLFSSSIFAQGWGYGMRGHSGTMGMNGGTGMMGWNQNVPEKYWLTAQQIDNVRQIRSDYGDKIVPLQQRLYSLRIQARGYASDPDADLGKIKDYREEIRGLEGKIDDLRLDARGEINKVLTKEQRVYFSDNFDWWDGGRDMMNGMGGMDNGYGMMNNMREMCPMMSGGGDW